MCPWKGELEDGVKGKDQKKKNKARREVVLASGFDFIELEASVKCDLT